MSSETAWKARYARLWKAAPTALGRVADVTMETAGHVLAALKAPARDSAP